MSIIIEYFDFVRSRFKNGSQIIYDAGSPSGTAFGLLHAAVGIVGEMWEYRQAQTLQNEREELGDSLFYIVAGLIECEATWEYADKAATIEHLMDGESVSLGVGPALLKEAVWCFDNNAFALLDYSKKYAIYNKPVDGALCVRLLGNMVRALRIMAAAADQSIYDLIESNMGKLRKRYPDGYSNKAAQERADKPEGE